MPEDPYHPPQELRRRELRSEENSKRQFQEKGTLFWQEEGETFVGCMERAAQQLLRTGEGQDAAAKQLSKVYVEPSFLTSQDWTEQFESYGWARGIQFAPFRPELLLLNLRQDGKVGWSPMNFILTTENYEDDGVR
jgi:hypothetical protein